MIDMPQLDQTIQTITFSQCADRCRQECIVFVKHNALNSYLWILLAGMVLITFFHFINKNEEVLREVALRTRQTDTKHIQQTIEWINFIGILLIVVYIAVFLITNQNIVPMS